MDSYLQTAPLTRRAIAGPAILTVEGKPVAGVTLLLTGGGTTGGKAVIVKRPDGDIPAADVIVYTGPADDLMTFARKLRGKGIKLLLAAESDASSKFLGMIGGKPSLPTTIEGTPSRRPPMTIATISADALNGIPAGADKIGRAHV